MHKNDLSQAERLSEDTSDPGLGTQSSSVICKGIRNKQAVLQSTEEDSNRTDLMKHTLEKYWQCHL